MPLPLIWPWRIEHRLLFNQPCHDPHPIIKTNTSLLPIPRIAMLYRVMQPWRTLNPCGKVRIRWRILIVKGSVGMYININLW